MQSRDIASALAGLPPHVRALAQHAYNPQTGQIDWNKVQNSMAQLRRFVKPPAQPVQKAPPPPGGGGGQQKMKTTPIMPVNTPQQPTTNVNTGTNGSLGSGTNNFNMKPQ